MMSMESWCTSSSDSSSEEVDSKEMCAAGTACSLRKPRPARPLSRSGTYGATVHSLAESEEDDHGDAQVFFKWMDARGQTGHCPRTTQQESSVYTKGQQRALADEAMKRAGEMCIWMQLKSLARRQQLRYPGAGKHSGADSDESDADEAVAQRPMALDRQALGREANRFDQAYAGVQETIRGRLCFQAPVRSNTVAIGEVARALAAEDA